MKSNINHIWSQDYWDSAATRIEIEYWEAVKDKLPHVKPLEQEHGTEHRIEKFVRTLSRASGIGNLHVGLTSSDIEDNVRAMRIDECLGIAAHSAAEVCGAVLAIPEVNLVAYTHLMPAGVTTSTNRFAPTVSASMRVSQPQQVSKGIGGAIGTRLIQRLLGVEGRMDSVLRATVQQEHRHQTGDHLYEFDAASYLAVQSALLAKIANDFRMMYAFGQAVPTQNDIGSTAIAGKRPNPWRFEKASGLAEQMYDLPARVARILSSCLLERTLTNQSVLNEMFESAFLTFDDICEQLLRGIKDTSLVDQTLECGDAKYHTEEEMLVLVLAGVPREEAHRIVNQKYK